MRQVLAFATTLLAFAPKLEASEQLLPNRDFDNFQKDFPAVAYQMNSSKSENIDSTSLRGRIFDKETSEPLPFVSILVKGTSYGFESDMHGYFELKLADILNQKDSITLEFYYTGYVPQEKTYKLNSIYDSFEKIVMIADTNGLEEAIVVGYVIYRSQTVNNTSDLHNTKIEQIKKRNRQIVLPWHKEFWQKRKQKKSNP